MANLNVEAPAMSRKQIRAFARAVREALGIENEIYIDIGCILEFTLPKVLKGFVFDVRDKQFMENDHGQARPDENFITLREDVYEGALEGKGRDRTTVIHELGHILLHKSDRMTHRRATGPSKAYRDPEWQAKAFAGEFLIPAHLISSLTTCQQVATACGVSLGAVQVQLRTYVKEGLIEKGQITDLAL